jgi:hypothetical protein
MHHRALAIFCISQYEDRRRMPNSYASDVMIPPRRSNRSEDNIALLALA